MGQLAGFSYREIVKRLKELGLKFHRQAAGSHEIWFNPALNRYTTIPNHPGDMPEGTLRAMLRQAGRAPHRSNSHTQSRLYPQLIGPIRQTLLD
jgi:predicted RNA binding protein YcfA (HicA-like mRNA interferase family)